MHIKKSKTDPILTSEAAKLIMLYKTLSFYPVNMTMVWYCAKYKGWSKIEYIKYF